MTQEIKYQGYTAVPSDYESPDGHLAASLNLISEDDQLKPVSPPRHIMDMADGDRLLFIHSVPEQENYIILRTSSDAADRLLWLEKSPAMTSTDAAATISDIDGVVDIAAVGNTLIIAARKGIIYILWKDGGYIFLGERPPFVAIEFGMDHSKSLHDNAKYAVSEKCLPSWDGTRGKADEADLAGITTAVYGLLNKAVAEKITSQGLFYQPFFIRYAYRLYDGSLWWHSSPVLMLPVVFPPKISLIHEGGRQDGGYVEAQFQLDLPCFTLRYRILSDIAAELGEWSDIVTGIDFFISAPLYTYDQSKDLEWRPIVSRNEWILSHAGITDDDDAAVPNKVFIGHYAISQRGNPDEDKDRYIDRYALLSDSSGAPVVNIRRPEDFHDRIRAAHDFYKVAELKIADVSKSDGLLPLKLLKDDLSNLVTKERMTDDYRSHFRLSASSLFSFNARLNLACREIAPPAPFPIRSLMQFSNDFGIESHNVRLKVWTRISGEKCVAVHERALRLPEDYIASLAANFPRYIFYPDASAFKMQVSAIGNDNQLHKYTFDLTPHDFLNGAYYYQGSFAVNTAPVQVKEETGDAVGAVSQSSKVYTSLVNNPFIFPVEGINTVGNGTVLGLSTAAKALSQGQFGQFPLYAFTTEGVWALETTATGSYSAKQPITRDVCVNPSSITQIDSAVLFFTARGIMLLSGSQTQCISEPVNSPTPFSLLSLPAMDKVHSMLGHPTSDTCFPTAPFLDFLASGGMVYDYLHQRIIVYSSRYSYSYIYSLKSRQWGMAAISLYSGINSFPEALAIDSSGSLVDFSQEPELRPDTGTPKLVGVLAVTRPLKLGAPDTLKTVDTVIQRGHFRRGDVQSILYGSRDLFNWHLIWSSQDHYLRGFSGTPYKFFRVAIIGSLLPGQSIFSATIKFNPRLTNQLR